MDELQAVPVNYDYMNEVKSQFFSFFAQKKNHKGVESCHHGNLRKTFLEKSHLFCFFVKTKKHILAAETGKLLQMLKSKKTRNLKIRWKKNLSISKLGNCSKVLET